MERRRHKRFDTSIPIKFRIRLPESPEVFWLHSGVLKNISFAVPISCPMTPFLWNQGKFETLPLHPVF